MGQQEVENLIRKEGRIEIQGLLKGLGIGRTAILNSIKSTSIIPCLINLRVKVTTHWKYYYSIKKDNKN